ncbi:MAG: hypothetical protein V4560_16675 [Bacteroidota bacterium]
MKENIYKFLKSNPAVLITLLSAYGYYSAFFFEKGSCLYFGIPATYINIEIIDVMKFTATTTVILVVLAFHLRGVVFDRGTVDARYFRKRVYFDVNFILVMAWYFLTLIIELSDIFYYVLCSIVIIVNVVTYFYLRNLIKKATGLIPDYSNQYPDETVETITEKIVQELAPIQYNKPKTFHEELLNYTMFITVIIPFIFGFMGYGDASKQKQFSVLSEHPSMAVIKRYGDEVICKNFNEKTGKLGDTLMVFKIDGTTNLKFTIKSIK